MILQPDKRTQKSKTESSDSSTSVSIEEEEEGESGDREEVEDPDETYGMLKYVVYIKNFFM